MEKSRPRRSCAGCGEVRDASEVLRFVVGPGCVVIPDITGAVPGRGAYLDPQPQCFRAAQQKKGFERAFKTKALDFDAEMSLSQVRSLLTAQFGRLLGQCQRAGLVVSGDRAVMRRLNNPEETHGIAVGFIASDVGENRAKRLENLFESHGIGHYRLLTTQQWGSFIGTRPRSVLLVQEAGLTGSLLRIHTFMAALSEHGTTTP